MLLHKRTIYPVGHGGMALEEIDGFRVMYDCGSDSNQTLLKRYIDDLVEQGCEKIDYLVLSHYDKDHVNSIKYLIKDKKIKVEKALVPAVPKNMEIVFDAATGHAYTEIRELLSSSGVQINYGESVQYGDNYNPKEGSHSPDDFSISYPSKTSDNHPLWRWDIHSMIKPEDWKYIERKLCEKGISITRLNDADYVASEDEKKNITKTINEVFRSKWRSQGSNGKGLIMLSQRTSQAFVIKESLQHDGTAFQNLNCTGCLYTGDANLQNRGNINDINQYLNGIGIVDKHLLLMMQIPHHGSQWNVNKTFPSDFPAEYYFYCDDTTVRATKNAVIQNLGKEVLWVSNNYSTTITGTVLVR